MGKLGKARGHYNISHRRKQGPESAKTDILPASAASNGQPEQKNAAVAGEIESEDQIRTRVNKKLFLEQFPKSKFIIHDTCQKIGINRDTFYNWRRDDPEFRMAVEAAIDKVVDLAYDALLYQMFQKQHAPSIHFFLERMDPRFKQKGEYTLNPGQKPLEEIADEEISETENETDKPTTNRGLPANPQQAGAARALPAKPGAGVLLAEKNPPQHNTESPAKRNLKDRRRGSARRLYPDAD